jgi:hypothetical protein
VHVSIRADETSFGPFDLAGDLGGLHCRLGAFRSGERGEDARLAFEELRHRAALIRRAAPELGERDGMERSRGGLGAHAEVGKPLDELSGSLPGERDREHVLGVEVSSACVPRDAASEDARLSRTGSGQDRDRRLGRGDRVALRIVEPGQELVGLDIRCGKGGSGHAGTVAVGCDRSAGRSAL